MSTQCLSPSSWKHQPRQPLDSVPGLHHLDQQYTEKQPGIRRPSGIPRTTNVVSYQLLERARQPVKEGLHGVVG